jgi:hypothetical protein
MSYYNLTNEEIVFLYFISSSVVIQYEQAFKDKSLKQSLETENGVIETVYKLPDHLVEELLASKHYILMKEISVKLEHLYQLIKDTEPEMVENVDKLFKNKPL